MISAGQLSRLDTERVDVVALWRVVWAHKYVVAACVFVAAAIAVYLALTAVPVYRAEATVTEATNGNMSGAASLANQLGGIASLVGVNVGNAGNNTREAMALLNSRKLVEEFITREKLLPVLFPKPGKNHTLWYAVRRFKEGLLAIREDKRAGTMLISVSWTDPVIAAKWANDFVSLANELMRARAMAESKASIAYLNAQIATTSAVEVQRVMYNLIENETKSLMLSNVKAEYAFTNIDPAVPPEIRASPRRMLMVLLGMAVGLFIGMIVAFLRNMQLHSRG